MLKPSWIRLAHAGLIRLNNGGAGDGGDGSDSSQDDSGTAETTSGEAALGDPGKKALDAMKAAKKAAEKEAREAREALAALQAKADGREAEYEADKNAREAADQRFHERIVRAEIKAVAVAKGVNPDLLTQLISAKDIEADSDGDVDSASIEAAVTQAIEKYDLAVQDGSRFSGSADAGVRKGSTAPQLTKADLNRMTPQQIEEARKKGQFDDLLGRKP